MGELSEGFFVTMGIASASASAFALLCFLSRYGQDHKEEIEKEYQEYLRSQKK